MEGVAYYVERLAEPELVERAVPIRNGPHATILAVPVGKLRRGGEIEIEYGREYVQEAVRVLSRHREGFPNLRIISFVDDNGNPVEDYIQVRWGDPVPFEGFDSRDPDCASMLGRYYGYKPEAIAECVTRYAGQRAPGAHRCPPMSKVADALPPPTRNNN